jgi:exosortase/archaeosortase family protein
VWRNRQLLHLAVLTLAGIALATLMNVVRITVVALAFHQFGVDWSKGLPHETLGLIVFLLTFLVLVSTDYALIVLLAPIKPNYQRLFGESVHYGARLVDAWDWLQAWGRPLALATDAAQPFPMTQSNLIRQGAVPGAAVLPAAPTAHEVSTAWPSTKIAFALVPLLAFGILAGAQFAVASWFPTPKTNNTRSLARARALDASVLPPALGAFNFVEFSSEDRSPDDIFGDHSRSYEYRNSDGNVFVVSCDFPFGPDWHDLTACYLGVGWKLTHHEVKHSVAATDDNQDWSYIEAAFAKPDGTTAYLVYCVFDEHGTSIQPPFSMRLENKLQLFWSQFGAARPERLFQVQVWTSTVGDIPDERRQETRDLLLQVRNRFRTIVTSDDQSRPTPGGADGEATANSG